MAIRNVKLTIAYDGSEYHGWQIQPGLRTVQGVITEAIRSLLGPKVRICGASRTDAGVSALGQVGLIQIDSPIPTDNLVCAITDRLPQDIVVVDAEEMPKGFDVIGAVKSKWYRYTIFTGPVRPVMQIKHCWHLPVKLDITSMDKAAKLFVGKKDFKSFAAAADKREDTVRTIFRCDVTSSPGFFDKDTPKDIEKTNLDLSEVQSTKYKIRDTRYENCWVHVDVQGDHFLYNMVRNIVGTLVEVGQGKYKPEKIPKILEATDRTAAGQIAPAAGLCLMRIEY